jgi:hypothetical protein
MVISYFEMFTESGVTEFTRFATFRFQSKTIDLIWFISDLLSLCKIQTKINMTTGPQQGRGERGGCLGRQFVRSGKIDKIKHKNTVLRQLSEL